MTPQLLAQAGTVLFGPEWQRALARGLGPLHPDGPRQSLDDRLVRRWAAGDKPIPPWVQPTLGKLVAERARDLVEQVREARRLSSTLLRIASSHPAPEERPDDGPVADGSVHYRDDEDPDLRED